jgi:tRNA A-37 threonylcarbamoyl transferase component Bud32
VQKSKASEHRSPHRGPSSAVTSPVSSTDASQSRYVVAEQLAQGGMGVVYRVFDRVDRKDRALKRVTAKGAEGRYFVEALEREFRVLKTLDHPRIIQVFDYGIDSDGPFYTMELLDGEDMRRAAPMPYAEVCARLRDVAASLSLLHARRLVHRDLSPGNVRMTKDGRCKLLDFGALASFGSSQIVVGTPPFVAPEALSFAPLDARTDLYALGALAYWLLTGQHAFPTTRLDALLGLWKVPPSPPSSLARDTPAELDTLVLSLLSIDPRARPATAAEVIALLTVIGGLAEDATENAQLATSFLANPRFVGRGQALEQVRVMTDAALQGRGGAVMIRAGAGMGRSRFLEEVGVAAQLGGAAVVRVDASTSRHVHGMTGALARRLLDAAPFAAQKHAAPFQVALSSLGADVKARLGASEKPSQPSGADPPPLGRALDGWFAAVSRDTPLVIQIDNVEDADDASLGVLAALAKAAAELPIVVMATEGTSGIDAAIGLSTLRERSTEVELQGLTAPEMLELTRSLFSDAPKVQRFAEWLFGWTAGSPLHALEISRQLLLEGTISYASGVWTLPDRVADAELPRALGDALSLRIRRLTEEARILAECLCLHRHQTTLELCRLLLEKGDERSVLSLLDELAQEDVLYFDRDGYRFSSTALRKALLAGMGTIDLEKHHRRLGNAFIQLASSTLEEGPALRLQAGFHFIQGGEEQRGAETIAGVTHDALTGTLIANLHRSGPPLDAALYVYNRQRRSIYERMPLLAALAQAGFYEDRLWGERYGPEALDVLEDLSGLRTARFLRRFLGGWLSLIVGISLAFARFSLSPKAERKYSFDKILVQLFTAVTTLAGAASLSLDADRAARIAAVLEPFSILPERLTPVGIYQYCVALKHIARDSQAEAYDTFNLLLARFENPRYYPTLPADARKLYVAGAHFARGAMAILRADGRGALESADALDEAGLRLYAMIASQLRWLYYTIRGEFSKATPHREQMEEHAAHVGSVWQVETWQGVSLLTVYPLLDDIVNCTRIAHQIELLSRTVPSLKDHARVAHSVLLLIRGELSDCSKLLRAFPHEEVEKRRGQVGWTLVQGHVARGFNMLGEHALVKEMCEAILADATKEDLEFAPLFLSLEQELAVADAALGSVDAALDRIDRAVARLESCDYPLALGLFEETRARIGWRAGKMDVYARGLAQVERWFLTTEEPLLVARCKRLRELSIRMDVSPPALDAEEASTETMVVTQTDVQERMSEATRKPLDSS